jgi:hypothetical protein
MSSSDRDSAFPFFEELNFAGWLIQFKAHLRRYDADDVLDTPIPKDHDANGVPIVMNARDRQQFDRDLAAYKEKDKIAYPEIMKACYKNLKTKNLCETGGFTTANEILTRLRKRFSSVDETVKASHLLRYSTLKQQEGETGADFVDREQKEFVALRDMGINVDDSLRLTKFIQQDTTNSHHKSLAQTIYTTPNMTLSRATSLFETYHPGLSPSESASAPVVNALFCRYCKQKGHEIQSCQKKTKNGQSKRKKPESKKQLPSGPKNKKKRFPCALCDATDHSTFQCPHKDEARKALGKSDRRVTWGGDERDFEEDK